jgi:hypothetical protein
MPSRLDLPPVDQPPAPVRKGGGDSAWIQLTTARNDIDAHLLVGRLEEGGIETRMMKDRRALGAWIYAGSNPWAPVSILVRRFQLDDARLILMEISLDAPDAQVPYKPRRPSGLHASAPMLWWATAVMLGVLFTALAVAQLGVLR